MWKLQDNKNRVRIGYKSPKDSKMSYKFKTFWIRLLIDMRKLNIMNENSISNKKKEYLRTGRKSKQKIGKIKKRTSILTHLV